MEHLGQRGMEQCLIAHRYTWKENDPLPGGPGQRLSAHTSIICKELLSELSSWERTKPWSTASSPNLFPSIHIFKDHTVIPQLFLRRFLANKAGTENPSDMAMAAQAMEGRARKMIPPHPHPQIPLVAQTSEGWCLQKPTGVSVV